MMSAIDIPEFLFENTQLLACYCLNLPSRSREMIGLEVIVLKRSQKLLRKSAACETLRISIHKLSEMLMQLDQLDYLKIDDRGGFSLITLKTLNSNHPRHRNSGFENADIPEISARDLAEYLDCVRRSLASKTLENAQRVMDGFLPRSGKLWLKMVRATIWRISRMTDFLRANPIPPLKLMSKR